MGKVPRVLSVAGSDSGGCSGQQADLRTFHALGVHGCSAITAVTAQNTRRVGAIYPIPATIVEAQLEAVLEDIGADAVKVGMLCNGEIVTAVARQLQRQPGLPVVLDPVLLSSTGARLLEQEAEATLLAELFPLATLVTPNWEEAAQLARLTLAGPPEVEAVAEQLCRTGAQAVLIKGGHSDDKEAVDYFYWQDRLTRLAAPRLATPHSRGSGCTLAAAIAAFLALGASLPDAVGKAKNYLSRALAAPRVPGSGPGAVGQPFVK